MQTQDSTIEPQEMNGDEKASPEPLKIRGFLIFVAIGLFMSLIGNLQNLGWSILPFRGEVWEKLTTPGFDSYHPNWKQALLFGVTSASVIFVFNIIMLVLFFRKHRFFPTFIVVAIPVIFVLLLVGHYLDGLVPAIAASQEYSKGTHQLIVRFIALHVWIPYFVVSERVKRTFVR